MNSVGLYRLAIPATSFSPGLREIQPGVLAKHQLGDAIPRPGRIPGAVEYAEVMLVAVQMDVCLIVIGILDTADADVSGCVGDPALLIECVLLVGDDAQITSAIVQLVAVDMIDFVLDAGIEHLVEYHGLSLVVGRRVSALSMVPGMILDHGQIEFIK